MHYAMRAGLGLRHARVTLMLTMDTVVKCSKTVSSCGSCSRSWYVRASDCAAQHTTYRNGSERQKMTKACDLSAQASAEALQQVLARASIRLHITATTSK